MNNLICTDCGANALQAFTETENFNYKGHLLRVEVEFSVCSKCGAEIILQDQIKRNDCRVRDAWRKADGLLSGTEIVALRKQLRLTQQKAAQLFGGGTNAFSKYERGEVIQSLAMDKLMRLAMEEQPVHVSHWLCRHAGLSVMDLDDTTNGYEKNMFPFQAKVPLRKVQIKSKEDFHRIDYPESYQELRYG